MLRDGMLRLRTIEQTDLPFMRNLANDPGVRENEVGWDWPLSNYGHERWLQGRVDADLAWRFQIEHEGGGPIGVYGLWEIDSRNRSVENLRDEYLVQREEILK